VPGALSRLSLTKTLTKTHWTHRTTNAFMEGLNSVFSAVKRKARGFRSTKNLIAMLYFTAGNLDLPATH
jgi:hypothetical protein